MTSSLGDPTGVLVALGLGGIRVSPVLLDFDGAASRLHSAIAVGVCGELGSGKSVLLKSLALSILARGGQCVAIDRSPPGEWEQAFAVVEGQQTISISPDATTSLDPLRTLPPAAAATVTQSFVTALLRIPVASVQGMLLSEVLDPSYRQTHTLRSMADVVGHLTAQSDPQAAELGRRIKAFANLDLARAIFDPTLPAAQLTAPALVVRTHELTLPSKDELTIRHLYEELPLEKILGRAIYTLAIATARRICFRDRSRLAFLFLDEAHSATISPEAERETSDWLRDGRKNKAGLALGSHDPSHDFGTDVLRRLIPVRVVMRHRDEDLAAASLKWLGLDPTTSPDVLDLVTTGLSPMPEGDQASADPTRAGEGVMRDLRNRIGLIKTLPPALPGAREAVFSTPPATSESPAT